VFRPPAGEDELRHGYTVSQVRALSLAVVTRQTWYQSVDFDQRLEVAWHAIIEHLYTVSEPPAMPEVARAAEYAVSQDVQQMHRFYGRNTHDRYAGTTAGFERYWRTSASLSAGHDTAVTERVAVTQIWPRLRPLNQDAIAALTNCEDYGLAASALGISRHTFTDRISVARREFLRLWHEGETPSRPWSYDRRASTGGIDALTSANRTIAARRRARGKTRQPARGGGRPRKELGITDGELARRYQDGQSIRQIAGSLGGIYYNVIRCRLIAQGVQLRPANGRPGSENGGEKPPGRNGRADAAH
jgi:hypothetical protein